MSGQVLTIRPAECGCLGHQDRHHMVVSLPAATSIRYLSKLVIPMFLALFAMYSCKGDGTLQFAPIPNAAIAAWLPFIGRMAVTGNWL